MVKSCSSFIFLSSFISISQQIYKIKPMANKNQSLSIMPVANNAMLSAFYMLGDLSGIEMREAQKSLLDAEERILAAEYNTKLCEISLLQISGKITKYLE